MYEGKEKTYYKGFAKSSDEFIIAAFIDELTAPDEAPYLTNQLTFSVNNGWSSLWYEENVITDFTDFYDNEVLALSEDASIFNALNGQFITKVDQGIFSHMNGIVSDGEQIAVAGTNGRFYVGDLSNFRMIPNEYFSPVPDVAATTEERVSWGRNMRFFFSISSQERQKYTITGSHGLIVSIDRGVLHETIIQPEIRISSQIFNAIDSKIWFCGHTPQAMIGVLNDPNNFDVLYLSSQNEYLASIEIFSGKVYVASSGNNSGVFILDNNTLIEMPFSNTATLGAARYLQSKDGILWALFEKALIRFDGDHWDIYRHPEYL